MARDDALMETAREGLATLRLYRWRPACLSLGRNQRARGRYDREEAARRGIDVVRRPTGGRAVLHSRELTYSVTAPAHAWGGLRECYRRINRALLRGLKRLGVEADLAERGSGRAPGPSGRACFRDPLPGEIVAHGQKLVGSAQWREAGALLQHGSILLRNEQAATEELRLRAGRAEGVPDRTAAAMRRAGAGGSSAGVRAAALEELLGRVPDVGEMVEALRRGFREEFGTAVRPGGTSAEEEARTRRLLKRYSSERWTWRR